MKIHLGQLAITTPAFEHGSRIPERHTADGEGVSPPLSWSNAPEGTRGFALVADDPDAPLTYGFNHWVLYGIPADVTSLDEGVTGHVQGANGTGHPGFTPPGPPPGHGQHFYYFHLFALDADLGLEPGLDRATLLDRIDDHIIEQARIVGTYDRS